jgi:hypothetical protein
MNTTIEYDARKMCLRGQKDGWVTNLASGIFPAEQTANSSTPTPQKKQMTRLAQTPRHNPKQQTPVADEIHTLATGASTGSKEC